MVPSVLLMSAGLLGSPLFIADVKARRETGHLRVEVQASGGIDPESARTRIDGGRLFLYLGGTRVRADNRAWDLDDGTGEIRAHRHKTETELVVPLARTGCAGPVELAGTAEGMTALVGCEGETAVVPAKRAASVRPVAAAAVVPEKKRPVAEKEPPAAEAPVATAALKVAVALPEAVVKAEKAEQAEKPAVAPTPTPTKLKEAPKPALAAKAARKAAAAEAPVAALALPASRSEGAGGTAGLRAVAMPAVLLAGLAIAAYVFARRRRTVGRRYVQILETATLGPKRSIVVARVGEETLILGSSEAGITLLRTEAGASSTSTSRSVAAAARAELEQPLAEALADIPEPGPVKGQTPATERDVQPATARKLAFRALEGGLAGLLGRRGAEAAATRPDAGDTFDDLLEDSIEDQELRQKLAAGFAARVR